MNHVIKNYLPEGHADVSDTSICRVHIKISDLGLATTIGQSLWIKSGNSEEASSLASLHP